MSTNKASNILQDTDILHLFARVVSDLCKSVEECEIRLHARRLQHLGKPSNYNARKASHDFPTTFVRLDLTIRSVHVDIKETVSVSLLRAFSSDFGSDLQSKQHPNVAKFYPNQEKVIALKDPSRSSQLAKRLPCSSGAMRARTRATSLSRVSSFAQISLRRRRPHTPTGSYPTVSDASTNLSLNPSSHALDWSIPRVSAEERSGTLEFNVGGDDAGAFFPVKVAFVSQGSLAGIDVSKVTRVSAGEGCRMRCSVRSMLCCDASAIRACRPCL
ncbi:hypothetical protein JVU11DRAFT_10945 [Chiua virens]|nr:hypothetical protein JVU11DRAFT_10945 [Chiua virens]